MANLRSITQINPESIVYDERTKQYHDVANRYRMVKKSIAESMQAAISSGAPTRGNENLVSQATFDAFRKDIYKHISETARLTKIGLEELKKSFDYQTKETGRLQRAINNADEESQEQNRIEKISDDSEEKRKRRQPRRGLSMSSYLGLGIGGIIGTFLLASLMLTPQQHQEIGESIDNAINMIPDIQSIIRDINRISNLLQPFVDLIQGIREAANNPDQPGGISGAGAFMGVGAADVDALGLRPEPQNANGAAIGRSLDAERQFALAPSAALAPPTAPTSPPARPQENQGGSTTGGPLRYIPPAGEDDPSSPHRVISEGLLTPEERNTVNAMNVDPNNSLDEIRNTVIGMLARSLEGRDRNALAESISRGIGSTPLIHNSAEVARNIITSIDNGVGFNEAARRLYETFFEREVTGGAIPMESSRQNRSEELRRRLNRYNSQRESSVNRNGMSGVRQIAAIGGGNGNRVTTNILPAISLPQNNRSPGGRYPGQSAPPMMGAIAPPIGPTNNDPSAQRIASLARAMGMAT